MNIAQIEQNLQLLVKSFKAGSFIYELLLAYGTPKSSISRLQKGGLNLSNIEGEIAWKKKLFFKAVEGDELRERFLNISKDNKTLKYNPRFIVITDFKTLLAIDSKTQETLDVAISDLAKHFDFFLPWAGMEKAQHQNENPADVKAAEKMAKLYDDIKKDNPINTQVEVHNLNVFLSRLLFCFFAEDTGILAKGQFTLGIASHTQQDGSDLNVYLDKLFEVMNTPQSKRKTLDGTELPQYLNAFPYVNGGLFRNNHTAPTFTRRSRQSVIDSGELDWAAINPDIFGSMIQAVITPEHRGGLGMHYTSVPNIMKVIEPLFLNELYEEFDASTNKALTTIQRSKKLNALLHRIWKIKIFDPACGSGNFLIIAYKELRKLEMKIFKALGSLAFSNISLGNFYGIEIDDFAHEVAILSLWLAEHQMNQDFLKAFGRTKPALPLTETGNIVHGNATRLDWDVVCPKEKSDEVYILGNPPYLGYALQSAEQKEDMEFVFKNIVDYKKLDFIACWFYLGSKYIEKSNSKFAFVTTNSICQGEQVAILWPHIINNKLEIKFAYQSFKWKNNAKANAAVAVAIIGIRNSSDKTKKLFHTNTNKYTFVKNINPYLVAADNSFIESRSSPLSKLPLMIKGCSPGDNGNLLMSEIERNELLKKHPLIKHLIKEYLGADEFMNSSKRYCLWIPTKEVKLAYSIPELEKRFEKCKKFRLASKKAATRKKAATPHEFDEKKYEES
ncbi:MAG: class I SAM-dependent DNA methyltransferase, partial [Saprospiraceae bacterium]|nr:class I SAM-dependent DNA methyltransferase [Saprospiraceae bacterium]